MRSLYSSYIEGSSNCATPQFLSRDPLISLTRSPYRFVAGNSLNATDPSGLAETPPQPSDESPFAAGANINGKWVNYDAHGNIPCKGSGIITGLGRVKSWARKHGYDFTDDELHRALGRLKADVDGNPDVGVDPSDGEVYVKNPDGSFAPDSLGNLGDELDAQSGKDYSSAVDLSGAGAAGLAGGGFGLLWWIGKALSPLCGPAAPACVIAA